MGSALRSFNLRPASKPGKPQQHVACELAEALHTALPHARTFIRINQEISEAGNETVRQTDRNQIDHELIEKILSQEVPDADAQCQLTLPLNTNVGFAAVPIESCATGRQSGFLAAVSHEVGFPTPQDRAVLQMAAVAAKHALGDSINASDNSSDLTCNDALHRVSDSSTRGEDAATEMQLPFYTIPQPEALASLGTLAAGLSHDLGNLLLPIRLRLATIETRLSDGQFSQDFSAIRTCLDSLQRLAHGLELFALNPEQIAASEGGFRLHEWWPDIEPFIRNMLPSGIVLVADIPDDLPPIAMAQHLLAQVLVNLVQNAGDALRTRGRGRVDLHVRASTAGDSLVLTVSDDGPGMDKHIASRCFEPFFTTKTRSISTGLGLSLVHGIVKRAGGSIDIRSQPGHGTTIQLKLRTHVEPATDIRKPASCKASIHVTDARLSGFVSSFLHALGVEVVTAAHQPHAGAALWITDDIERVLSHCKSFLHGAKERRIVAIGHMEQAIDGVYTLGKQPDRAGLSRTLRQCVQRVMNTRNRSQPDAGKQKPEDSCRQ